jgi:hypothetical protein
MKRVLALAVAGALTFAAPAWADREHSTNNTSKKLREAVTVPGILEHEAALQRISTFNGGNRLSGAPGYDGLRELRGRAGRRPRAPGQPPDFDYELDLLADYTPPVVSVTAGGPARSFIPGIGGTLFSEGDFGSMYRRRQATSPRRCGRPTSISTRPPPRATTAAVRRRTTPGCRLARSCSCSGTRPARSGPKFFGAQQFGAGAIFWFDAAGGDWINVDGTSIPSVAGRLSSATALANGKEQGLTASPRA